jgi:hypothetical protein
VFSVEEPVLAPGEARLDVSPRPEGVHVVVPHLPPGLEEREIESMMQALLSGLRRERGLRDLVLVVLRALRAAVHPRARRERRRLRLH